MLPTSGAGRLGRPKIVLMITSLLILCDDRFTGLRTVAE
jgi:hypothetical protein